ncbi:MAG TPA: hypothetical protein VF070_43850 [Streptosporangiaceae bacterium]
MPGPGTARDGTAQTTAVQVQSAAARLSDGLDGWRRHMVRQRSAAAARRWLLITLGTALAGVMAGRLDGSPLLTAAAASSIALAAGAVRVVRSRKVSRDDAARLLDATFGLDEQVATALCFADDRTVDQSPLVASLIERATGLVAQAQSQASGEAVPGPAPAYGEWAVIAVTAASVAAVGAVPGTVPGPHRVAGSSNAADEARTGQQARPTFGASATASDRMRTGRAAAPASGTASPARGTVARSPDARPASPPPSGSAASGSAAAPGGPGKRPGGPSPVGGSASSPSGGSASLGGPAAATSRTTAAEGGTSAPTGRTSATAGRTPAAAGQPTGAPATGQPALAQPATGQPATARAGTARAGTARTGTAHAGTARAGKGQRKTGAPGGDTAGSQPGDNRTGNGPAQLLPLAGDRILLIVLPGGDGLPTAKAQAQARANPDTSAQQAEGNGGTTTATASGTESGSSVAYVPPDDNEVPFGDQSLLGRYF